MIKYEQLKKGLFAFIEGEFLASMSGAELWMSSFCVGLARSQVDSIATVFFNNPIFAQMDLINEAGEINIESAIASAKETVKKCGKLDIKIPMVGIFTLGEESFDMLYEYIIDAGAK